MNNEERTAKESPKVKQVIVIRRDLRMRRGKECAQTGHASIMWLANRISINSTASLKLARATLLPAEAEWLNKSMKKVVVQVDSLDDLMSVVEKAKAAKVIVEVVTDSGLTEFNGEPTITCAAVGPDWDEKIDPITGHLKLY